MKDRDEIIKAAHKHALKGNIDNAIAEYLKILPYSVDGNIHNIIGDLYLKKESTDEAIKYFREAAVIFNKDQSHAKAIALYNKILSIKPDHHDVIIELAELNAERSFIKQALDGLTSAAEAYFSKGLPMKALGVYKKALAVCPSETELKIKIADMHLETGHSDRAIKMYLAIAKEYEANAESVKAEDMYKKVILLDPDNLESLTHLSRLAEDDQDLELAFEYISKAAAAAPHNSEIMFDYSNLATKTNKDISEYSVQENDGAEHNKPKHIEVSDAVNDSGKSGNAHEPLNLSSESTENSNLHSREPVSASTSPLPMTSTESGSEVTGFTFHPDEGETVIEKSGIWEDSFHEDKNNPSEIDSSSVKTLKAVTGHETAEADYDHNTGEYEFNMSVKKPDHEIAEKDSRRLKRRVKKNGLHVVLVLFFVLVTGLSFFITFKFMKKTQTVDIETPAHVITRKPLAGTEAKTRGSSSDNSKTYTQNKAEAHKKTEAITKENTIMTNNQGLLNLPSREIEPAINDSRTNLYSTDDMTLNEEDSNSADTQNVFIESAMNTDNDITQERDSNPADMQNKFTESAMNTDSNIPQEQDSTTIDSETDIVSETVKDIQQEEAHNKEGTAIISFEEPFNNNNNNWNIIQTSAAYVRLKDGKYHIQNRRESGAYIILNGPDLSTDNDFAIEAHVNLIDNSGKHSFGLVFGAKDKEDFFTFQMLPEHEYSIRKYYRGVSLELADGKINSKPESQELFNVLKINNKDNKLSFFINENFVDEVSDISFSNKKTGFYINGKAEIVVDKILIHQQSR